MIIIKNITLLIIIASKKYYKTSTTNNLFNKRNEKYIYLTMYLMMYVPFFFVCT